METIGEISVEMNENTPPPEGQVEPPRRPEENPFNMIRKAVVQGFCDPRKEIAAQKQREEEEEAKIKEGEDSSLQSDEHAGRASLISNGALSPTQEANPQDAKEDSKGTPQMIRTWIAAIDELKNQQKIWSQEMRRGRTLSADNSSEGGIADASSTSDGERPISPGPDICVRGLFSPLKGFVADRRMAVEWTSPIPSDDEDSEDEASTPRAHICLRLPPRATDDEFNLPSLAETTTEDDFTLVHGVALPTKPKGILKDSSMHKRPKKTLRSIATMKRRQYVLEATFLTILVVALTLTALQRVGCHIGVEFRIKAPQETSPMSFRPKSIHFTKHTFSRDVVGIDNLDKGLEICQISSQNRDTVQRDYCQQ